MKYLLAAILILISLPAYAGTLSGDWSGSWTSSMYSASGNISLSLTDAGSTVSGTLTLTNTDCGTVSAPISGTVSGGVASLQTTTSCGGNQIAFKALFPTDIGNTHSANWTIFLQNGSVYDQGSFTINRQTPATRSVTASATTGATISPSGATSVDYKGDVSYTISAQSGYTITDVEVDGVSVGVRSSYTFSNVTSNHTIHAIAASNSHTISASATAGASISPSGSVTVSRGNNQSFTISAQAGYSITDVVVDGVSQGVRSSYTFTNVTANHTIQAVAASNSHTISASATAGASISPSGSVTVTRGNNQSFTISAQAGYSITDVVVDGVSQGVRSSYTFTNVTANHTIQAVAAGMSYTISTTPAAGASFTPSGNVTVNHGGSQEFSIHVDGGYTLTDVKVDGVSVGAVTNYTFSDVIANHTIVLETTQNPRHVITATAATGATIWPSGAIDVADHSSYGFSVSAQPGYILEDVQVDGVSIGVVSSYFFSGVTANHTIHAIAKEDPTPSSGVTKSAQAGSTRYTVHFIGQDKDGLYVEDINDSNQVVGYYYDSSEGHGQKSFVYSGGVISRVNGLATANAINNAGVIVGETPDNYGAVIINGESRNIPRLDEPYAFATAINNNGIVTGHADSSAGKTPYTVDSNTTPYTLNTLTELIGHSSYSYDINDLNEITGRFQSPTAEYPSAYKYDASGLHVYDALIPWSSLGEAINNTGDIAGSYSPATGVFRAFVVLDGTFVDLTPEYNNASAKDINTEGQVVGNYYTDGQYHSFVYTEGTRHDLVLKDAGDLHLRATCINDQGVIAGNVRGAPHSIGFIAVPNTGVSITPVLHLLLLE